MGKLKAWAQERGMLEPDEATEQQFHAEWQAELEQQESDAEWLAWLDRMTNYQECEQ
jgi:hypothetical protein